MLVNRLLLMNWCKATSRDPAWEVGSRQSANEIFMIFSWTRLLRASVSDREWVQIEVRSNNVIDLKNGFYS